MSRSTGTRWSVPVDWGPRVLVLPERLAVRERLAAVRHFSAGCTPFCGQGHDLHQMEFRIGECLARHSCQHRNRTRIAWRQYRKKRTRHHRPTPTISPSMRVAFHPVSTDHSLFDAMAHMSAPSKCPNPLWNWKLPLMYKIFLQPHVFFRHRSSLFPPADGSRRYGSFSASASGAGTPRGGLLPPATDASSYRANSATSSPSAGVRERVLRNFAVDPSLGPAPARGPRPLGNNGGVPRPIHRGDYQENLHLKNRETNQEMKRREPTLSRKEITLDVVAQGDFAGAGGAGGGRGTPADGGCGPNGKVRWTKAEGGPPVGSGPPGGVVSSPRGENGSACSSGAPASTSGGGARLHAGAGKKSIPAGVPGSGVLALAEEERLVKKTKKIEQLFAGERGPEPPRLRRRGLSNGGAGAASASSFSVTVGSSASLALPAVVGTTGAPLCGPPLVLGAAGGRVPALQEGVRNSGKIVGVVADNSRTKPAPAAPPVGAGEPSVTQQKSELKGQHGALDTTSLPSGGTTMLARSGPKLPPDYASVIQPLLNHEVRRRIPLEEQVREWRERVRIERLSRLKAEDELKQLEALWAQKCADRERALGSLGSLAAGV